MTLDDIAKKHQTDKSSLAHGYCDIYERYFGHLRDEKINLLEIGVQFGLSIQTWQEFFHNGEIYGVDLVENFRSDNPHVHLFQGDASHAAFWNGFARGVNFDIIVEDSNHLASTHQIVLQSLWPRLKPGGFLIFEDVFTHFDPHFYSEVDGVLWLGNIYGALNLNGQRYHGKPVPVKELALTTLERELDCVHLYFGLVILHKKP
jgi:hypothetical protein